MYDKNLFLFPFPKRRWTSMKWSHQHQAVCSRLFSAVQVYCKVTLEWWSPPIQHELRDNQRIDGQLLERDTAVGHRSSSIWRQ